MDHALYKDTPLFFHGTAVTGTSKEPDTVGIFARSTAQLGETVGPTFGCFVFVGCVVFEE